MDKNKSKFVAAMKARGGLKHYDLGGNVTPGQALNPTSMTSMPSSGVAGYAVNPGGTIMGQLPSVGGTNVQAGVNGSQSSGGLIGSITPQSQYSANLAPTTQLNYAPTAGAASTGALDNINNMTSLEGTLGNIAAGGGPQPAQTQFQQNLGNIQSQQAATAAGQRGASGNVGLMERNIGQQGAATAQQAAGTALASQQTQQLGALGAEAGVQNNIAGANQGLYGTATGANNAQNTGNIANYAQMQGVNANTSLANTQTQSSMIGGLAGGGGSALTALMAKGGTVPGPQATPPVTMASGGQAPAPAPQPYNAQSFVGQLLSQSQQAPQSAAKGGKIVTTPEMASKGEAVPGKVQGKKNDIKNDKVPAMLTPEEIVLPISVTKAADAPQKAAAFVQHVKAKQGMKRKGKK
jgi:hypothetical protein